MDISADYFADKLNAYETPNSGNQLIHIEDVNSEQLRNLVMEAFEIGFVKCNSEDKNYNFLTIIEMVKQIIPTGFVVGSSYWVLYNLQDVEFPCICKMYNLDCPHTRGDTTWVQTPDLQESENFEVINRVDKEISIPQNFTMETRSDNKTINIFLTSNLHIHNTEGNMNVLQRTTPFYTCQLEFDIIPQLSPHNKTISLNPHPHITHYCGKIFPVLKERAVYITDHGKELWAPDSFETEPEELQQVTLVVKSCNFFNVPVYKEFSTIYNCCKVCLKSPRKNLEMKDHYTQTEESTSN